jgi:hypothetical protein
MAPQKSMNRRKRIFGPILFDQMSINQHFISPSSSICPLDMNPKPYADEASVLPLCYHFRLSTDQHTFNRLPCDQFVIVKYHLSDDTQRNIKNGLPRVAIQTFCAMSWRPENQ